MVPSGYEINVAKFSGLGWNQRPTYKWFCTINAGTFRDHAKEVADYTKLAFPAPEYQVTLRQRYECAEIVESF